MSRTIAVLADAHANFAALEAILGHLATHPVDGCWFLGDAVGRGPEALPTINALRSLYAQQTAADQACWLAGNHDWMVLGKIETNFFAQAFANISGMSREAVLVANKHRLELQGRQAAWEWLSSLPLYAHPAPALYLVHGSLRYAENGEPDTLSAHSDYAFPEVLSAVMRHMLANAPQQPHLVLCGHTHVAGLWQWDEARGQLLAHDIDAAPVTLTDLAQRPALLNPGSAGFPRRGGCPSYVRLTLPDETGYEALTAELVRVPYDPAMASLPDYYEYPAAFVEAMQTCGE